MASKVILQGARKNVARTARALRKDRMGDFRHANAVDDAIFGNLAGLIRGQGRKLTQSNAAILQKMLALQARQRAVGRAAGAASDSATAAYGGAGDIVRNAFSSATAQAKAGSAVARGLVAAGRSNVATGNDLISIAKSSAAEAQAGAQDATARALAQRGQQDAATVGQMRQQVLLEEAQMAHDVRMQEMQNQQALRMERMQEAYGLQQQQQQADLSWREWKKQQDYATKKVGTTAAGMYIGIAHSVADVMLQVRQEHAANPQEDISTAMQNVVTNLGLSPQDPSMPVYTRLIAKLWSMGGDTGGPGTRDQNVALLTQVLFDAYPDFRKHRDVIERLIGASLKNANAQWEKQQGLDPSSSGADLNSTLNNLETVGTFAGGFPGMAIGLGRVLGDHVVNPLLSGNGFATTVEGNGLESILQQPS